MNGTDLPVELPRPIADALDRGYTVVTANQRAARTLRVAFDRSKHRLGLASWQPAAALAWDAWTADLWRSLLLEGQASDLLLNRTQEHAIWRGIISTDPEMQSTLRSPDSLAELAADAWRLLARYNGLQRLRGTWANPETRTFQRWTAEFERRCRAERLLPQASLEITLRTAIEQGRLRLAGAIALAGFDEMTPAQRRLIEAVTSSGTPVEELSIAAAAPKARSLTCAEDERQEIAAAARWARRLLQNHPEARIALIVPSLEDRRSSINRIFREVLAPELEDIAAPNNAAPYEFSLGVTLAETPMVRVALDLLRWATAPLPIERISALLVSSLFAMAEQELNARAAFDAFELRKAKILRPEASLGWLADMVASSRRRQQLTSLISTLRTTVHFAEGLSATGERRSYGTWADAMREFLQAARWGRGTQEDSIEFQTRRKWESALDELATLDFDGARVDFAQARAALERITRLTMFAPESRYAAVQIMGPLEAAGSSFDAVWFAGASDLKWPASVSTNPLLPWPLQRELGMPATDAAADDARARRIMQRIVESAPTAIFSYAAESPDGKQRPSPVLDVLHLSTVDIAEIAPALMEPAVVSLEEFTDVTPIPPLPDRIVRGGAEILHLQAACGFRAFAERRLWSAELQELELGMDARERGTIIHQTLEHFWNEVRTQASLKEMTREQRQTALNRAIDHGLRHASATAKGWDKAYVDVQRARLWNLLDPWLDLELERDPFSVKLSEKSFDDVRIGPLRLKIRVDRVDAGESGETIIDYKTSMAKPSDWRTSRPDEPQLPLYAVLAADAQPETQLAEVAFARIRLGKEMALDGFTRKVTSERNKAKPQTISLDEQIEEWRSVLTSLAEAFHHGDARVDPKKYPNTCSYCAQRILCRLDPVAFDEDFDEEEAIGTGNG
ncbi:PD-(D/E)XK nuclease family protein [Edaphobacter aggregans]|uniref:PD-(D/E)XK nuclease family protein n=1 Tax=Edaphobacter aggregans TaxID=570835 RepID=UPI0005518487|nr:PD-(D/E)XK nuclease family protein [Edaphobacter aggregans]